jgi:hypothetical protein
MNLEFVSFADAGNLQKERVVLKATGAIDLGNYTLLCSASSEPGSGSSGANDAYWFPNMVVKENDLVVVYTKGGKDAQKETGAGHTAYFFYWGIKGPLWGAGENALVLIRADEWKLVDSMAPEEG